MNNRERRSSNGDVMVDISELQRISKLIQLKRPDLSSRWDSALIILTGRSVTRIAEGYVVEGEERPAKHYIVSLSGEDMTIFCPCHDHRHKAPDGNCKHILAVLVVERSLLSHLGLKNNEEKGETEKDRLTESPMLVVFLK